MSFQDPFECMYCDPSYPFLWLDDGFQKIICSCLINPRAEIALPSPSRYIKLMVNAVLLFKEFMLFFMVVDVKNNYFNPQGVVKKIYFNRGAFVSRLSL